MGALVPIADMFNTAPPSQINVSQIKDFAGFIAALVVDAQNGEQPADT